MSPDPVDGLTIGITTPTWDGVPPGAGSQTRLPRASPEAGPAVTDAPMP